MTGACRVRYFVPCPTQPTIEALGGVQKMVEVFDEYELHIVDLRGASGYTATDIVDTIHGCMHYKF